MKMPTPMKSSKPIYCGQCKYHNDWFHTYVEYDEYTHACCSYWHVGFTRRNVARRPACEAFISRDKKEYV